MKKQRFSKQVVREAIEAERESAIRVYESYAGRDYDPRNGNAQIPNTASPRAWDYYGRIMACDQLLITLGFEE